FGTSAVHREYVRANLMTLQQSNEELVHKLARLPLLQQPGTTFEYGLSTDVLGRVVEVVSAMSLDRFIEERIARPLRLSSFSFEVADATRLARTLSRSAEDAELDEINNDLRPPRWLSGGGGLNGTAADYLRFAQMLLNGGELEGTRL